MPKVSTDAKKIDWLLNRAVENVYPSKAEVKKLLQKGERLTVYFGIDPTGPTLHLGHFINFRRLALFQELGHKVILLIGDFTATIGDPTDKAAVRKPLTREEVLANCKLYKDQAAQVLDFKGSNAVELKFNSEWLGKMNFADVLDLASHFTVQQMLERDMFQTRLKDGKPIHVHEFMYPLMQGYDSVAMDVDGEVGGNDQTFNMLAGRTLMKQLKNKDKFVITNELLVDPTGKKMGKSEGNMIALTDAPEDMYGKVMSWTDGMIVPGFRLCTDASDEEIKKIETAMKKGENPMTYKRDLAKRVVAWLVGEKEADQAAEHFTNVHQKHATPDEIPELKVKDRMSLVDALVASGLCSSKSDARRQIEQGGVKVDDEVVKDPNTNVRKGFVIQKGKRHFVKLV
ncbi:tyrosine--tRNA ligase [Candidatus Uhrbacteria bacterium]|nr:MAG: tyrosine--tRNA ligase [Candidatus Uhrbacteria bacterium]